jgi:hypothetical protein
MILVSSQKLQVPEIQDNLSSNHEILDTGDLSQLNLVYNNIIFQLYPGRSTNY